MRGVDHGGGEKCQSLISLPRHPRRALLDVLRIWQIASEAPGSHLDAKLPRHHAPRCIRVITACFCGGCFDQIHIHTPSRTGSLFKPLAARARIRPTSNQDKHQHMCTAINGAAHTSSSIPSAARCERTSIRRARGLDPPPLRTSSYSSAIPSSSRLRAIFRCILLACLHARRVPRFRKRLPSWPYMHPSRRSATSLALHLDFRFTRTTSRGALPSSAVARCLWMVHVHHPQPPHNALTSPAPQSFPREPIAPSSTS
jgi:hypothetical protein